MTPTTDRPRLPGDLILVEFGPVRGSEQDGRRPALVVSVSALNAQTRRVVVCPITGNVLPWPTEVFLPAGLAVKGAVPTDQVRSIDQKARILRRLGAVPDALVAVVRYQLALVLGLDR